MKQTRKIAGSHSSVGADATDQVDGASKKSSDSKEIEKRDARRTAWEKWVVDKAREQRQHAEQELAAQRVRRDQEEKVWGYFLYNESNEVC